MELRFKLSALLIPVGWVLALKQTKKSSEMSRTKGMDDNSAESADLISEMPDALLLHILSFLDKMAVFRTSVLSKRWSYLWKLVPFPTHTKEMKSSFMELKGYILKRKLYHEEVAREDVSDLVLFIAKIIRTYSLFCLAFLFMLDFNYFAVTNTFCTVGYMKMIYSGWCCRLSYLCDKEADLKRLQEDESRLTATMNAVFTTIPTMNPLFPQNFQPRYSKSAKLYGLLGMLVFMIMSCSATVLKWKFEFSHVTGGLGVFSLAIFVLNK